MRSGLLIPEDRGVYLLAHRAPAQWGREFAAALACGPGAVISHRSAARIHGMISYSASGQVWVTTTSQRGAGIRGVKRIQTRVLEPDELCFEGWLPVTSAARTALDLAGVEEPGMLESAVAAAQVGQLVREEELWEQLGRGRRGSAALRRMMSRHVTPANVRSKAERLMLRLIRRSDLPEPLVNVKVGRWRPDFYWPQQRVVAEFDSYEFHTDIEAFRRDREKGNELQLMGIVVLRFTWHDLTRTPDALEARLRQALGLG